MKEIKINYSEYELPENPNVFNKIGKFVCEYFGFELYRNDKTFTIKVENPDLFLSNNKSFAVKNDFIEKDKTKNETKANLAKDESKFQIEKWQYKFISENECEIVVATKKQKPSQIETLYTNMKGDWQMLIPFFTIITLSGLVLFTYSLITDYPNPLFFWSFIGKYIQATIGWSLFILLFGLYIWSLTFYRGNIILRNYLAAITVLLSLIVPIFWMSISVKPKEFIGQSDENILYLNYLKNYFSTSTLILIGIIPWITIFLKYLGFSLLPAILNQFYKDRSE